MRYLDLLPTCGKPVNHGGTEADLIAVRPSGNGIQSRMRLGSGW
ncbi:MAG: hypothetical protein U5L72_19210 [Bacteroidales bacterium]|nr:hypothetical protein [Bacteroidales bacterium]